jgi:TPR repeat protein
MLRRCPRCNSFNVRRSSLRPGDAPNGPLLHSPYRCRDCGERFWLVTSRLVSLGYTVAIVVVSAGIAGTAWYLLSDGSTVQATNTPPDAHYTETLALAGRSEPTAEYELYRIYAKGDGVARNPNEARAWLQRAANHGLADAQYELAVSYREGRGVVQDYRNAAKWMHLAAKHGHPQAQYDLGLMYRSGVGIPADPSKAYIWLNLAASQGFAGAAAVRDALLAQLSPAELLAAQDEARRMSEVQPNSSPAEE